MAACALAASVDGAPSFSERIRVDQILETLEQLQVFDPHEAVELFNEYAEDILADPKEGKDRARKALAAFVDERETAELLIRICLAVAEASGETNLTEQVEIVTLCSLLGVDPDYASLYTHPSSGLLPPTSSTS